MKITAAYTRDQFETMEALGRRIVPDFYAQYLPPECADYLVRLSHTVEAFESQVAEGYRHYMVEIGEEPVGYFGLHEEDHTMVLTQFYLLQEWRGKGIGQRVMDFIHREADDLRVKRIELLVLRKNTVALALYRKNGYSVAAEVLTPVDTGHTLEDYVMQKSFDRQ
ncbi:GNAT family N-acetyltransferase [Puia sp.]|jgi:GNAT superfamily N-acetyltransferase|uniref:GNAT family N-acetyltransferase n=1 Tax=Puia sp. TaxID=2045100 RepID=UPI002F413A63